MASPAKTQPTSKIATKVASLRSLDTLCPHPKQGVFFPPTSENEVASLAEDLKRFGLKVPIEICRDGTIIAGHTRVAAARMLGWTEIEAVVRDDLATQKEIEQELVRDNLHRRQLSPLRRVRCVRFLLESSDADDGKMDIRARIGAQLGCSMKTVQRLENVLKLPPQAQEWFDSGEIKNRDVAATLRLSEDRRLELAKAAKSGAEFRRLLKLKVTKPSPAGNDANVVFKTLIAAIEPASKKLIDRSADCIAFAVDHRESLLAAKTILDRLLQIATPQPVTAAFGTPFEQLDTVSSRTAPKKTSPVKRNRRLKA